MKRPAMRRRSLHVLLLALSHGLLAGAGVWLGRSAALAVSSFGDELVSTDFFAPAAKLHLRHGTLEQARAASARYESYAEGLPVESYATDLALFGVFAKLQKKERAAGNTAGALEASRRATQHCKRAGLPMCAGSK